MALKKECKKCEYRLECVSSDEFKHEYEIVMDTFQGGDQIDNGVLRLRLCPGEAERVLGEFWNMVERFAKKYGGHTDSY